MSAPRELVIAGSDSGGEVGVQADLKAITAFGCHAMKAITAITGQNTLDVRDVLVLEPAQVVAQIDAVLTDIGVDAIKIGMTGSPAIAEAVADRFSREDARLPLVFDPMMVATSSAIPADEATIAAFERLMASTASSPLICRSWPCFPRKEPRRWRAAPKLRCWSRADTGGRAAC